MKTIPDLATEILSRSSTPALPLPRLVEAIAEETASQGASAERILAELRSCPDLFRVLDPLIGPWRRATARPGSVVEPRDVGPRPPSQYPSKLTRVGPDRGKPSLPGKKGQREFSNGRSPLASTDRAVRPRQSTHRVNHPVRHSLSASTCSSPKLRTAAAQDTPGHSSSVIPLKINHPLGLSAPVRLFKSGTRTVA